ncbi:MAG: hypothetical protein WAL35_07205 [Acidimicrobiales bacterium]
MADSDSGGSAILRPSGGVERPPEEANVTKRTGDHHEMVGRFAAAILCLGAAGSLAAGGADAAPVRHGGSTTDTFHISGAGKGTLHAGPLSGCLNNLVKTNGLTDVNGLVGMISGFSKDVKSWSLTVTEKKTGKFVITGSLLGGPKVELVPSPTTLSEFAKVVPEDTFYGKSGTVTLGAETGSIAASLATVAGQQIEISGSWRCKA